MLGRRGAASRALDTDVVLSASDSLSLPIFPPPLCLFPSLSSSFFFQVFFPLLALMIRIDHYYKLQTFEHLFASPFPLSVLKQGKSYLKEHKE